MAGESGQASDAVNLQNALRDHPEAFEFFAAARRLECAFPEQPRIGRSARPADDPVRLRHTPSMEFAPRSIDRYEPGGAGRPGQLHGFFLGLFGPNGPLPLHLTEYALDRERYERDRTFRAFADIFHHRMLGLFYRAWADAEPTVQFDRPAEDRFRTYLGALVGLATAGLADRDALPDHYKLHHAGRMWQQSRDAEGLRGMIETFFRVPVKVVEFVAEWMRLPQDSRLRLGESPETGALGLTTVIGESVRVGQSRFRLRLGPLDFDAFNKFLPGGEALRQLVALVRGYAGDEKSWDVQLVLRKEEVPAGRLGRSSRLGLTSWIAPPQPAIDDVEDVVLRPLA